MKSGIYKITCLANKKFYIGSSNDIKRRWQEHKSCLRRGSHRNSYLQRCWSKYGEKNLKFEVVEYVPENQLLDVEQFYLDSLKSYIGSIGLNLTKEAKGCGADANEKDYIITCPSGEELKIKNLSRFCREHGFGNGLSLVARGLMNKANGYKARFANQSKEDWEKTRVRADKSGAGWKGKYKIKFPTGKEEIVTSLNNFCSNHGLSQGSLRQTCVGKRNHYKGFSATYILEDI